MIEIGFRNEDRAVVGWLLRDYEQGLGVSLCFQDFDAEIASLPGACAPPRGVFLTARFKGGRIAGLVALRCLDAGTGISEMKRLSVSPEARGRGLGRELALAVIAEARRLGYRHVRLDTLPSMAGAQALHADLGFRDIANYTGNPIAGARFLELDLAAGAGSPR